MATQYSRNTIPEAETFEPDEIWKKPPYHDDPSHGHRRRPSRSISEPRAETPWNKDYFPNLPLTTQDGKQVQFFDDLIKDKIVVINFIYTSCPDTCPLETAQLVQVQEILGDRMGKDVHFYSISLDPENDTVAVLKEYSEKFHARWTFLTGKQEDVFEIQKKLGLFVEEIEEGLSKHNINMIIGNQTTGRWMKRSPMENPYVLADQVGNWLDGWKRPPELDAYENAPELRDISPGEQMFRTRCASCHSVAGQDRKIALGPDLLGVTRKRDPHWLINWLKAPDQMLKDKDPIAMELFEQYNKIAMPNMRLNQEEAIDLLDYLEAEAQRLLGEAGDSPWSELSRNLAAGELPLPAKVTKLPATLGSAAKESAPVIAAELTKSATATGPPDDVVAVMNAWIQSGHSAAKVNSGYVTLMNGGAEAHTLTGIRSSAFESVVISEMAKINGTMRRQTLPELVISAGKLTVLEPGGIHLTLRGRKVPLAAGDKIDLTLMFETGAQQAITLSVIDRGQDYGKIEEAAEPKPLCPGCLLNKDVEGGDGEIVKK